MSPWPKRARRPWTTAGWHGRAAIPQQHARRPNRRPSTPNPVPHVQENGEWAVYALAAIPHADVERLSKFLRARPVHIAGASGSCATQRGREEINALLWAMARSIGPRPANSISRRRAETVRPPQSRDPSAAQGTRGYFRKSFPSGYIESNTNRVAGLPRWPPTRRCAACGVANGPTTLVSHVSFAGFPCGNAYCLEQALLGD